MQARHNKQNLFENFQKQIRQSKAKHFLPFPAKLGQRPKHPSSLDPPNNLSKLSSSATTSSFKSSINSQIQLDLSVQPDLSVRQISELNNYKDQTYLVADPAKYPYSAVGVVISDSRTMRTGFIVGPQSILTSANSCYDLRRKKEYTTVSFTPGPVYKTGVQKYKVRNIYYPQQFEDGDIGLKDSQNDSIILGNCALLQLDTTDDLEQMYGSLGYDFREQKPANILRKVFIIGYTLDNEVRLNQFSGDVLIEDRVLKHKMNTKPGCSGAPIVQLTQGIYQVRGIHCAQLQGKEKVGVIMNERLFEAIRMAGTITTINFAALSSRIKLQGLIQFSGYMKTNLQECLRNPVILNLSDNNIGTKGCEILKQADMKNLRLLHLYIYPGRNNIDHEGCVHLKQAHWHFLQELYLGQNKVGDKGCTHLKLGKWPHLQKLELWDNQIGDEGCRQLKAGEWPNLRTLYLDGNKINKSLIKDTKLRFGIIL